VRCAAAFAHKGVTYYGCTTVDSKGGAPWCYTDEARGAWDYCAAPCDHFSGGGLPGHWAAGGRTRSEGGPFLDGLGLLLFALVAVAGGGFLLFVCLRAVTRPGGGRGLVADAADAIDSCAEAMRGMFRGPARPRPRPQRAGPANSGGFGRDAFGSAGAQYEKGPAAGRYGPESGPGVDDLDRPPAGGSFAGPGAGPAPPGKSALGAGKSAAGFQQMDDDML